MKRWQCTFGLILLLTAGVVCADVKEHDFQYKELPLLKVIESLAKMQGKSVLFSRAFEDRPVTISLASVTAPFALKLILENFGYIAIPKGDVLHIMTQGERGIASTTPTNIIHLTNVIAKDIVDNVRTMVGAGNGINIAVNEQLNTLMVTAPDEILIKIKQLVTELDQEAAQVYIEAKLIETSTSFSRSLGIEWGTQGLSRAQGFSVAAPSAETALIGLVRNGSLEARITAGERNGDVRVISSPKITTLNGLAANISSQTTYSIRTLTATPNASGGATAQQNGGIQSVSAGVGLLVTPYIVSQEQVRLNIALNKSDPDFANAVDGIPGISNNSANTSLIVRNGQTASIGGLIRHTNSNNTQGMPLLSKLPLVGMLFGSNEKKRDDKELLIFITPTIFRNDRPAWGAAEEKEEPSADDLTFQGMTPLRSPAEAAAPATAKADAAAPVTPVAPAVPAVPPAPATPPASAQPPLAKP